MNAKRVAASLLLGVLLAACAGTPGSPTPMGSSPLRSPGVLTSLAPTVEPATPKPTYVPSPTPAPSASPSASPAATLVWHRLGAIPMRYPSDLAVAGEIGSSPIDGLVGFAKGYVVLDGHAGAVWHSKDGRSWKRVRLPIQLPLEEAKDGNGMLGRVITTNGREVLVVGGYSHAPCHRGVGATGGGPECAVSPITWISADGRTWRRAFADSDGEFVAAWPVAGGWMAAESSWSGACLYGAMLWRSADGIRWKRTETTPPAAWEGYDRVPVGIASETGTQILAASERIWPPWRTVTTVATAVEGGSWRVLGGFPGEGAQVVAGVALTAGRSAWVLGGWSATSVHVAASYHEAPDEWTVPTAWSSVDGVKWTLTVLPVGPGLPPTEPGDTGVQVTAVTSVALTERGYVAVGAYGTPHGGARHETWVSDDGATWSRLPQPATPRFDYGPGLVANGPAGVIGISGTKAHDELVVWQLR